LGKARNSAPSHKIYRLCVRGAFSLKSFAKPLTQEEEQLMLLAYHNGDMASRNILVEKNMRLVAHIAKKYSMPDTDGEDLISVGTIGLIKAVNSFKPDKGIRLATYAARCIDNEILMMLRARKKAAREVSYYEPAGKDKEGNEISIIDTVSDEPVDIVADMVFNQRVDVVCAYIKTALSDRESCIIRHRYGLFGADELTQSQIADRLGISRSYVSRIEKKVLKELRELLEDKGL
jgi:RNA polymerase sporulation-specific sigma factor